MKILIRIILNFSVAPDVPGTLDRSKLGLHGSLDRTSSLFSPPGRAGPSKAWAVPYSGGHPRELYSRTGTRTEALPQSLELSLRHDNFSVHAILSGLYPCRTMSPPLSAPQGERDACNWMALLSVILGHKRGRQVTWWERSSGWAGQPLSTLVSRGSAPISTWLFGSVTRRNIDERGRGKQCG